MIVMITIVIAMIIMIVILITVTILHSDHDMGNVHIMADVELQPGNHSYCME